MHPIVITDRAEPNREEKQQQQNLHTTYTVSHI